MHKHGKDCPGMSSISLFGWSMHINFCSSYWFIELEETLTPDLLDIRRHLISCMPFK